jgi:hypothetical protein
MNNKYLISVTLYLLYRNYLNKHIQYIIYTTLIEI